MVDKTGTNVRKKSLKIPNG